MSPVADQDLDTRRRRALYRAEHRGTKEMDLVLGPFAKARLASMPEATLALFEALLLEPDPELQEMFLADRQPEARFAALVGEIRAFHGLGAAGR
ncbi:MAG: succinate dehydrogenase assembly factor 2 [Hyphomicrobiaceae bacterium]|nr:succinate dehydrogenase assembly factor 2 [Hyphomicrobiaceae bacterium]